MKVNFVRKPTPEEIYPQDEFIIEKVVRLSKEEFEDLLKHPLNDRDYIRENKDKMYEIISKNKTDVIFVGQKLYI